ncbi:patched family protein [Ditylenchus destructor]|uniref:Patched family protein n=1 Tax=Ditylenchus destructor TaxID=166010 RepID=A0AAD4N684_9BILA|nr:patched family protein [Ditylenchus destructor]
MACRGPSGTIKGKGLVVKGTGYTSPALQPSTLTQPTSSSAARTPPRRLSQPAGNGSLRRSGSVGNIAGSYRAPLVPQRTPTNATARPARYSNSQIAEQTVVCNCQHPADVAFLENVYVQNLQTQIEVLELENNYLRTQPDATPNKSILREERDSRPHREPDNQAELSSYYNASASTGPSYQTPGRKRVEFMEEAQVVNSMNSHQLPPKPMSSQPYHSLQPYNGRTRELQRFHDEDLFLKLEQAFQNEYMLEEKIKSLTAENRKLASTKEDLDTITERMSRERRSIMEDNVELQRRLDELTPLLAEKEARIAKLENDKEQSSARLRSANMELSNLRARVDERKREESLLSEIDSDRKQEIERLREKIRNLEMELTDQRSRENNLLDELASLKHALNEEQTVIRQERALREKVMQENSDLIKEQAELQSQSRRYEHQLEQNQRELSSTRRTETAQREIDELRHIEKTLRTDLKMAEERLKREQDTLRAFKEQEEDRESKDEKYRDAMQKALSNSLTNENKGLREEKIAVDEKIELLQNRLSYKADHIRELTERLEEFKQRYIDIANRLRIEINKHSERGQELENIVKLAHELSDNGSTRRRSSFTHQLPGSSSPHTLTRRPGSATTEVVSASRISSKESTSPAELKSPPKMSPKAIVESEESHMPHMPSSSEILRSAKRTESIHVRQMRHHRRSTRFESTDEESTSAPQREDALAQRYRRKLS